MLEPIGSHLVSVCQLLDYDHMRIVACFVFWAMELYTTTAVQPNKGTEQSSFRSIPQTLPCWTGIFANQLRLMVGVNRLFLKFIFES